MDPNMFFGFVGPANNFAMGVLSMYLAKVLLMEGKSLPKELFVEVVVEKTQKLIEHVNNHHLGLCLTANINRNSEIIWIYDNFTSVNTQVLQITLSNLPDLEDQLFHLYVEVIGIIHNFMPEDFDDMPSLEDITDEES